MPIEVLAHLPWYPFELMRTKGHSCNGLPAGRHEQGHQQGRRGQATSMSAMPVRREKAASAMINRMPARDRSGALGSRRGS